jgi:hypothetical protein
MAAKHGVLALILAALSSVAADADVWDAQSSNDNDFRGATNELLHGTIQTHDIGARPGGVTDEDWYLMPQKARASYEVVIDGVSGDAVGSAPDSGLRLFRLAFDSGTTVTLLQVDTAAVGGSRGNSRALRWANTTDPVNQTIGVFGARCGNLCGSDDVYTIRVRETTINVPRFNTAGTQSTVLLTENASELLIHATFFYWDASGQLVGITTAILNPKQLNVANVASVPGLAGRSGSISVVHDGGYGALVVKAVALEPATGFSFDTPGVYVPY